MATNSLNALLTYKELVNLVHDTKWHVYDITGADWPKTITVTRLINSALYFSKWYDDGTSTHNNTAAREHNIAIEFYFVYYYMNYFSSPVFCIDVDIQQYLENSGNPLMRDRHFLFMMYNGTEYKDVMICAQTELSTYSSYSDRYELKFILNSFSPISANYLKDSTNAHIVYRLQVKEMQV